MTNNYSSKHIYINSLFFHSNFKPRIFSRRMAASSSSFHPSASPMQSRLHDIDPPTKISPEYDFTANPVYRSRKVTSPASLSASMVSASDHLSSLRLFLSLILRMTNPPQGRQQHLLALLSASLCLQLLPWHHLLAWHSPGTNYSGSPTYVDDWVGETDSSSTCYPVLGLL